MNSRTLVFQYPFYLPDSRRLIQFEPSYWQSLGLSLVETQYECDCGATAISCPVCDHCLNEMGAG